VPATSAAATRTHDVTLFAAECDICALGM